MNIALFGYGRMGKEIEKIAIERGHQIVQIIDRETSGVHLGDVDVAIDFSLPSAAFNNIAMCFQQSTPVISGTTGWLERYGEVTALCDKHNGSFLYASNFSLGVNIFFRLNEILAALMKSHSEYTPSIKEIHHTKKLDAPSGTAITLAEQIIANTGYESYTLGRPQPKEISITSERTADTPGTHLIAYKSAIDSITIEHEAHSRSGFAMGAVIAAEWIAGRRGVFTMKDVLNLL